MPTTRRIVAAAAGTIALAFAATSCSTGSGGDEIDPSADITEQTLTVSIWADYSPEDLAEQFEEATGVKTTIVNHTTNEDIVAKLTASADPGIDVAFVSGQYAQALDEQGLLAELDKSLIPNEENLYPEATRARPTTRATSTPSPTRGARPASATAPTSPATTPRRGTTC